MQKRQPQSPISPFNLERFFARWEFTAPYLLCTSDVQGWQMTDLIALADHETRALWENLTLGYTETTGLPLLRQEIAGLYSSLHAQNILCFGGAEEAIYTCMRVLIQPGDHVIATFPGYQSLYQVAESIGAHVSRWEVRPVSTPQGCREWKIDLDELRGLITPETRLVVTNFPHNPTGALPTHAEWQAMKNIIEETGCYWFSDEVYRLLEYDVANRLLPAADCYDKALSLGVMSKPFGLAGLRIGWIATRDECLLEQAAMYKDYTTLCNSAPSEVLALIALRASEQVLARSLKIIQSNLALIEQFMQRHTDHFEWIPPRAGSIAFPRWLGQLPASQFAEKLAQEQGVLLLPSAVYDYSGSHFRLGLGRLNIPEGLDRLEEYLKTGGVER